MSAARAAPAADALAATLRAAILDGAPAAGERLREQALADDYDVARHTVRAALRRLEAEGLVRITPNAGARVAGLVQAQIADLATTRTLLEVGAVRLALARGRGRLPPEVHAAAARFATLCRSVVSPTWGAVVLGHAALHEALVAAAGSPRLAQAHATLSTELALFLVQGRPHHTVEELAADHLALVAALEAEGPSALEAHLAASAAALLAPAAGERPA